jgi:type I restriction enzyme, S subunit
MPETLPLGWVRSTLGEITEPSRDRVLPARLPGARYVGLEHIESQSMKLLDRGQGREVRSSSVRFAKNDVLYGRLRPYLNKVWVAEFDGLCSAEFLVFPERDGINSRFLAARLNMEDFVAFANEQVSGERPRVSFEKLSHFQILLPPTVEQDRIVAKLDASLNGLDRAEAITNRARERLHRYRSAVLHAALTGELTRGWRAAKEADGDEEGESGGVLLRLLLISRRARWEEIESRRLTEKGQVLSDDKWKLRYPEPTAPSLKSAPDLPHTWAWASLDQICIVVRGASPRPAGDPRYFGGSIPWITVGSLTRDPQPYLMETTDFLTEAGKAASRYIEAETLLLTNSGWTLGVPKISRIAGCINDGIVALLGLDYPLKLFLYYALLTQTETLRNIDQGASQPNLNTGIIRSIVTAIPPFAEQTIIIRELERRLSAADRLAVSLNEQLARARAMRQLLLREAFAGQLVPQIVDDEPAPVLLERIRSARQVETRKPGGVTMPNPKGRVRTRRELLAILKENGRSMTPEELFRASGYSQDLVDRFFIELRELTTKPAKISEERTSSGATMLKAIS